MPEITIVDDDKQIAELVAEIGSISGYSVTLYTEARKFLQDYFLVKDSSIENALPKKKETDIIFLDISMPDVDGFEVITELGKRQSKTALVLMSGYDEKLLHSAQHYAQEYDLNVIDVLSKPFDIPHIMQLLEKLKNSFPRD